jgi:hypothetical protein
VSRRPLPAPPQQPRPQNGIHEPFLKKPKVEDEGSKRGSKRQPPAPKPPGAKAAKTEKRLKTLTRYNGAVKNPDGKPMCFAFNTGGCTNSGCKFQHACGGCFKQNVSMKDCPTCKGGH